MTRGNKPLKPKLLWYVLSFLVSPLGIIVGIIYVRKLGSEVERFGSKCIVIGVISVILCCICLFILFPCGVSDSLFR